MAASPAWFFSTLAQATAAIVGLTIAFIITTHMSRREYIRRRTDRIHEDTIRLREKYHGVFDTMAHLLREECDFSYAQVRFDLDNEIDEWAENQEDPAAARVWAYVSGVAQILTDIESAYSPELDNEDFGRLNRAGRNLPSSLDVMGSGQGVYVQVTNTSSEPPSGFHVEDIFEDHDRIRSWLSRNTTEDHDHTAGVAPDPDLFSGKNIFSWATISEEFERDITLLTSKTPSTDVTDNFTSPNFARRVLITDAKLAVVGIFLPLLFLVSSPDVSLPQLISQFIEGLSDWSWVVDWSTIVLEVILLATSGRYTAGLFVLMLVDLGYTPPSTMRDLLEPPGGEDGN